MAHESMHGYRSPHHAQQQLPPASLFPPGVMHPASTAYSPSQAMYRGQCNQTFHTAPAQAFRHLPEPASSPGPWQSLHPDMRSHAANLHAASVSSHASATQAAFARRMANLQAHDSMQSPVFTPREGHLAMHGPALTHPTMRPATVGHAVRPVESPYPMKSTENPTRFTPPPGASKVQINKTLMGWMDASGNVIHTWRKTKRGTRGGGHRRKSDGDHEALSGAGTPPLASSAMPHDKPTSMHSAATNRTPVATPGTPRAASYKSDGTHTPHLSKGPGEVDEELLSERLSEVSFTPHLAVRSQPHVSPITTEGHRVGRDANPSFPSSRSASVDGKLDLQTQVLSPAQLEQVMMENMALRSELEALLEERQDERLGEMTRKAHSEAEIQRLKRQINQIKSDCSSLQQQLLLSVQPMPIADTTS